MICNGMQKAILAASNWGKIATGMGLSTAGSRALSAAAFYFVCSISMNFLNKVVVSSYGFNYPFFIMACQVSKSKWYYFAHIYRASYPFVSLDDRYCGAAGPVPPVRAPHLPVGVHVPLRSCISSRVALLRSPRHPQPLGPPRNEHPHVRRHQEVHAARQPRTQRRHSKETTSVQVISRLTDRLLIK
jgi:hypothetical protein